jgi:hypothetical protein
MQKRAAPVLVEIYFYFVLYCSLYYCCYATIARRKMCCSVTVGKQLKNIRALAMQPLITTIKELLRSVFSVVFAPRLYDEDPRPAEVTEPGLTEDMQILYINCL